MAEPALAVSEGAVSLSVIFQRTGYLDLEVDVTCTYTPGSVIPGTCRV